jgi:hypothetical protein
MLIGSGASIFVSVGAYKLYTSTYEVPGPQFPAPTAEIWLDMAKLVTLHLQALPDVVTWGLLKHLWNEARLLGGNVVLCGKLGAFLLCRSMAGGCQSMFSASARVQH